MKSFKPLPMIKKTDKTSNVLEKEAVILEDRLKLLKQQVEQDKIKRQGQKRWQAANDTLPLSNYAKQILIKKQDAIQKKQQSQHVYQTQPIKNQQISLSKSLVDFLQQFNCEKFEQSFIDHNIIKFDDLIQFEDITKLDIPPGFKIKMKLKLQKLKQTLLKEIPQDLNIEKKFDQAQTQRQENKKKIESQLSTEIQISKKLSCYQCFKITFEEIAVNFQNKQFCQFQCKEEFLKKQKGQCQICGKLTEERLNIFCSEECALFDENEFNQQIYEIQKNQQQFEKQEENTQQTQLLEDDLDCIDLSI